MKHYKGPLGDFIFDETLFALNKLGYLQYCGSFKDGCMQGSIPDGIKICDYMFKDCKDLRVGPVLPKSCIAANYMFAGCSNLVVFPDIDEALMETNEDFDYNTMFLNCDKLATLCISVDNNKSIVPYICACESSADYPQHYSKMMKSIQEHNERTIACWKASHWLLLKIKKLTDDEIKKQVPYFNPKKFHSVEFYNHSDYVHVLSERRKGNFIGLPRNPLNKKPLNSVTKSVSSVITDVHSDAPWRMDLS